MVSTSKSVFGQAVLLIVLFAMLLFAIVWASLAWESTDVQMSIHGWIALGLGTTLSLFVGCGLMALMFYSSRSGYDETVAPKVQPEDEEEQPRSGQDIRDQ